MAWLLAATLTMLGVLAMQGLANAHALVGDNSTVKNTCELGYTTFASAARSKSADMAKMAAADFKLCLRRASGVKARDLALAQFAAIEMIWVYDADRTERQRYGDALSRYGKALLMRKDVSPEDKDYVRRVLDESEP